MMMDPGAMWLIAPGSSVLFNIAVSFSNQGKNFAKYLFVWYWLHTWNFASGRLWRKFWLYFRLCCSRDLQWVLFCECFSISFLTSWWTTVQVFSVHNSRLQWVYSLYRCKGILWKLWQNKWHKDRRGVQKPLPLQKCDWVQSYYSQEKDVVLLCLQSAGIGFNSYFTDKGTYARRECSK